MIDWTLTRIEPDVYEPDEELAAIAAKYRIADTHCHVYPKKVAEKAVLGIGGFYDIKMSANSGDTGTLMANGSTIGVDKYVICSVATTLKQVDSINRFIASECEEHGEFIGLGAYHVDVPDVEELLDNVVSLGLRGIKIHPDIQGVAIDDERILPLYRELERRGLPILIHMGDRRYDFSHPKRLCNVFEKYPDLRVIAAHFGAHGIVEEARELLKDTPAMFDTSSSLPIFPAEYGNELVHWYGPERLMFGVDFPMWHHACEFRRFLSMGLTEEENQMILYDNFARFYGVDD